MAEATLIRRSARNLAVMDGSPVGLAPGATGALATTATTMLAVDPTAIVDAPGPIRGAAAFVAVLLLGGGLRWRYGAFVGRSVDAALARPLWSIGYGVAAHAVVGFAAMYLADQVAQVDAVGRYAGDVGLLVGGLLVLLAGALGFTVVGGVILDLWGARDDWSGLVVGAVIAGAVAVAEPLLAGLAWIAIVSMGIGGPVREWLHASAVSDI